MIAFTILKAWGSGLWHFLKTPTGRYLAAALVVMAALFLVRAEGYRAGVKHEVAAQAERVKAAQKHVAKVEAKSAEITKAVGDELIKTQTEIRWRTRTQLQEVVRYVPVESDRACIVGVGALRLHDHALAGLPGLPEPAGGPVEADSGVPLSALIADDIAFAGTAYDWKAETVAWRAWYGRQAALMKSTIKAPEPAP